MRWTADGPALGALVLTEVALAKGGAEVNVLMRDRAVRWSAYSVSKPQPRAAESVTAWASQASPSQGVSTFVPAALNRQ